jgi:hypothetical protein
MLFDIFYEFASDSAAAVSPQPLGQDRAVAAHFVLAGESVSNDRMVFVWLAGQDDSAAFAALVLLAGNSVLDVVDVGTLAIVNPAHGHRSRSPGA